MPSDTPELPPSPRRLAVAGPPSARWGPERWTVVACVVLLAVAGCSRSGSDRWQGYVEAEFVRVASPLTGTLEHLAVRRGDTVTNGQPLFALERRADGAAWREASERHRQAQAHYENLQKGRRPTEMAALEARLSQARAALDLAERDWQRSDQLAAQGVLSASELDRARTVRDSSRQRADEVEAELATARLGAREDEIAAAAAEVAATRAAVVRTRWAVDQKQSVASVDALVQDTLYRPGELVLAGNPVVTLLPPANLKVRFFVPQPQLNRVQVGQRVGIHFDGAADPWSARITYIAPQAEYTPPVIYSQENRAKLVFLVEAQFDSPDVGRLHPGQPAEVELVEPTAGVAGEGGSR